MAKHLPRRTFLRGLGTAIGLPILDAMTPAFAAPSTVAVPPVRLMIVYAPTGMMPQYWYPNSTGSDFEFARILKPLEPLRKDILVVSNLAHRNALALGDGPGDHSRAAATYLTGVHPKKTEGADIRCGVSADQIAAAKLGASTRFASLEVTCEDSRQAGACDSYSCAYQSISWRSATQPLPPEMNPQSVFDRLFGDLDFAGSDNERRKRELYRKSILDLASQDTQSLKTGLGSTDKRKLDEYLTSIREIELRMEKAKTDNRQLPPGLSKPAGIPSSFADHARLMFDLITIAFQADLTRVATFMFAREGGLRTYPEIGVPEAHHSISHHRGDASLIEKLTQVSCYHTEQFAGFLGRLKATPESKGSMLDHCAITYGASIGDPNTHDHLHLPTLVAGNANGVLQTGRHLRLAEGTPMSNLHRTLLRAVGAPTETLGDSTGELPELLSS
jgi:hypothetical protein